MAERPWQVAPHDPIEQLEPNLWAVRTALPGGRKGGDRRMVIARRDDGKLVFYNAAPLDEAAMREVASFGTPAFLVLPYNLHMMDGHAFAERLGLHIYGPKNDKKMAARVKVEGGLEQFPADPAVQVVEAAGMKTGEAVMVVTSPGGKKSICFADVFMNAPKEGASLGARLAGFAGKPGLPWLMKLAFLKNKAAFKAQLLAWADDPQVERIVPSHGTIITVGARTMLRTVATEL